MKNDLSSVNVGDWIWTIQGGWVKVEKVLDDTRYAIVTKNESYTTAGKCVYSDTYPSAFTEPPSGFNAEPKPCEFKKGDKVLVRDFNNTRWCRRYFGYWSGWNKEKDDLKGVDIDAFNAALAELDREEK